MQCTYCTLCQDNGKTNSFTAGNSNFRTSKLERHVVHSDHQASVLAKSHSKIKQLKLFCIHFIQILTSYSNCNVYKVKY